ncbi:MAG: BMP family ABC transporter substrate-binding protein, partial [Desulfovibrio sp.]|nr:BMP family ABC transporter substrate-binding protein [Desulfovibrio sp.]
MTAPNPPRSPRLSLVLLLTTTAALLAVIFISVITFDISPSRPPAKIGFVIIGDITEAGWNASHYEGMRAACERFGLELVYREKVPEREAECAKAIQELIDSGCGLIFLASYGYAKVSERIIRNNPKTLFASISSDFTIPNLINTYIRTYQGRYVTGVLAGLHTRSGVVGYVAAMPTHEVCAGINAFALGLWRVNPVARLLVAWTGSWENKEKERRYTKQLIHKHDADFIAYHQDGLTVPQTAEEEGAAFVGYNTHIASFSEYNLTSVLYKWDIYYSHLLELYLRGDIYRFKNTWIGIEEDAIALSDFSELVSKEEQEEVNKIFRLCKELVLVRVEAEKNRLQIRLTYFYAVFLNTGILSLSLTSLLLRLT